MTILEDIQAFLAGGYVNIALYYIIVFIGLFIFYKVITQIFKRILFKYAETKNERSNAIIFLHLWRYIFILITIIVLLFAYTGSLEGLGLSAALLTAAMGWALQRPISGIAGWLMVIISKPFRIGDRIIIGNVKGDVVNLTLTHVYIGEIGGTVGGEERSGRIIMVPNSLLFESNIVNYTFSDEFVVDEVRNIVTYDSDVEVAKRIWEEAAVVATKQYKDKADKPIIRTYFNDSGIAINVKYKARADEREKIKSDITDLIFKQVTKNRKVRFAYPHTEVIFKKKSRKKA